MFSATLLLSSEPGRTLLLLSSVHYMATCLAQSETQVLHLQEIKPWRSDDLMLATITSKGCMGNNIIVFVTTQRDWFRSYQRRIP
jgi:hypothetical protein